MTAIKREKEYFIMIQYKNKRFAHSAICLFLCLVFALASCMGVAAGAAKPQGKYEGLKLIPGGQTFGVKFNTAGIIVVGFCDVDTKSGNICPASLAGLKEGDIIKEINGTAPKDANDFISLVDKSSGKSVSVTFTRAGVEKTAKLSPKYSVSEGKYKVGLCVRDSGAGIGTVTYIYPETYSFAGLGHGICSADSGRLVQMTRGVVTDVTVSGVKRGVSGVPGEIKGVFGSDKVGTLVGNTECGVYGMFSECPKDAAQAMPVGLRGDVKAGDAYILSTLDGAGVCRYDIQISSVRYEEKTSKCFTVTVTDPKLIEKTGGIVQGMSGSPIIQNGKLIGAVTHVMINNPTVGYGIFIENMLDNMPEVLR